VKVLVALDCVNDSNAALATVVSRGWPPDTVIRFITAMDRKESISEFFVNDPSDTWTAEQERIDHVRQHLAATIHGAAQRLPRAVRLEEHVVLGHVKEELLRFAEDWQADLIVVGSHIKSGITMPFLGSVAQTVLQHSHCSVHIARANRSQPAPKVVPGISNILLAVDHSPHSNATVDWVLKQGWNRPFRVKVLTALPPVQEQIAREKDPIKANKLVAAQHEMRASVNERLQICAQGMQQRFAAESVEHESVEGMPVEVILHAAQQWPADLLVIGSHGRSGITRFLLGSVSQAVAVKAPCPVEVVKLVNYPTREKPHEETSTRGDDDDRIPHVVI
jgi:nucleotide-binding universal stress UspA family protein